MWWSGAWFGDDSVHDGLVSSLSSSLLVSKHFLTFFLCMKIMEDDDVLGVYNVLLVGVDFKRCIHGPVSYTHLTLPTIYSV